MEEKKNFQISANSKKKGCENSLLCSDYLYSEPLSYKKVDFKKFENGKKNCNWKNSRQRNWLNNIGILQMSFTVNYSIILQLKWEPKNYEENMFGKKLNTTKKFIQYIINTYDYSKCEGLCWIIIYSNIRKCN